MTARAAVLEQLSGLAIDAVVIPYGRDLENVAGPTLMVRLDSIAKPGRDEPGVWRRYAVALLVIVPYTDNPEKAEDALDALLEDVLYELDKDVTPLVWTAATRGAFQDKWPCYEVTLSVPVTKE